MNPAVQKPARNTWNIFTQSNKISENDLEIWNKSNGRGANHYRLK